MDSDCLESLDSMVLQTLNQIPTIELYRTIILYLISDIPQDLLVFFDIFCENK